MGACSTCSLLTPFCIISPLVIAFFICSIALIILHTVLCCHHHPSSRSSALTGILIHLLLLGGWLRLDWNILLDLVILFHCLLGCHRRSWGRRRKKVRLRRVLDGGLHSGVAGRGGRMTWMAK